jgi:dipeptidyl aminopeptidase/acylaminoacyl peptidase
MNLKTRKRITLSNLAESAKPRWNPNGSKVIFQNKGTKSKPTHVTIWIVNKDGSDLHQLIHPSNENIHTVCFSKDGKKIAFVNGKFICVCDSNGQNVIPLEVTKDNKYKWVSDWSPDNKMIVFMSEIEYPYFTIWLIGADGSNQYLLKDNIDVQSIKWSRKTGFIFYNTKSTLFRIKSDGSEDRMICTLGDKESVFDFDISPDEHYVVFNTSEPEVEPEIFLLKLPNDN